MGCRELDEKPGLKGLGSRRDFSVGVRGRLDSQTFWLASLSGLRHAIAEFINCAGFNTILGIISIFQNVTVKFLP